MRKKTIIINGANFSDLEGFYIEIDRVLTKNKRTGHNLDAFDEILEGDFGVAEYREPIKIIWQNISKNKKELGLAATKKWYEERIIFFEDDKESLQYYENKLKELNDSNGQTLFDIIIEIISKHKHIEFKTEI